MIWDAALCRQVKVCVPAKFCTLCLPSYHAITCIHLRSTIFLSMRIFTKLHCLPEKSRACNITLQVKFYSAKTHNKHILPSPDTFKTHILSVWRFLPSAAYSPTIVLRAFSATSQWHRGLGVLHVVGQVLPQTVYSRSGDPVGCRYSRLSARR